MVESQVLWFEEIGMGDVPRVGGKNASLGELIQSLKTQGVRVPDGFATTPPPTGRSSTRTGSRRPCARGSSTTAPATRRCAPPARPSGSCSWPANSPKTSPSRSAPTTGAGERAGAGQALRRRPQQRHGRGPARREFRRPAGDLPEHRRGAGAAGRLPPLLRLALHRPGHQLPRGQGLRPHGRGPLDRGPADGALRRGRSGVMFSIDTDSGFPRAAVISAAWGLGETVVQGTINPDKYLVFKPLLADE